MGFAGMARVLTDKKAHSLIGLSTGSNIVRSSFFLFLFFYFFSFWFVRSFVRSFFFFCLCVSSSAAFLFRIVLPSGIVWHCFVFCSLLFCVFVLFGLCHRVPFFLMVFAFFLILPFFVFVGHFVSFVLFDCLFSHSSFLICS